MRWHSAIAFFLFVVVTASPDTRKRGQWLTTAGEYDSISQLPRRSQNKSRPSDGDVRL